MPQFIQEITSVSHTLLCCLKMNWWAQKTQADSGNVLMGQQSFPQRVHDAAGSDGQFAGRGTGISLCQNLTVFFKSMGLMQSYKKGKLIHTVAGMI